MVDNKKQRKSTRSFNMEKHVERHFEIEKEELPVGDTSLKKPDEVSDGNPLLWCSDEAVFCSGR